MIWTTEGCHMKKRQKLSESGVIWYTTLLYQMHDSGVRTRREGKIVHVTVPGKDILKCLLALGCAVTVAFTVRL